MKKKGSHVEMVISFVIFIGFLLFFYIIIEPAIDTATDEEYLLDSLEINIINYFSDDVRSYDLTFTLNEADCDENSISNCVEINLSPNNESLFFNYENYKYQNNYPNNLSIWCGDCNEDSYTLFFSDYFSEENSGSECIAHKLDANCYKLKSRSSDEHIFKSRIEELKILYETIGLENEIRDELSIPEDNWFWFELTDNSGSSIISPEESNIPEDVNVYSREIPITYIDEAQNPEDKEVGFLLIKIW